MSEDDFLKRVVAALEHAGVPYMVTGSYASSAHGVPRATNDLDVVIAPDEGQLALLLAEFPPDRYYADEEAAFDALRWHSQFNVIDFATAFKADLIVKKEREFSTVEMKRRLRWTIGGVAVWVASAEDVLLSKLESAKLGQSERQLVDAAGIIERQGEALDHRYIEQWAGELGLEQEWQMLLRQVRRPGDA